MKTLNCVLLSFFVVSQLNAQTSLKTNIIAFHAQVNVKADTIALNAQMNKSIDIIALATSAAYQKDFEKADRLLTKYNADHIDVDALSLHAQVLYWMKAFDRSIDVYEKAIRLFPQRSSLHLDYARVLFNSKRLMKARQVLKTYRQYDSTNVEAEIMTAYLDLWNGKTGLAEKKANLLLQKYPGNAQAKDIITQVGYYTVPYIKTGIEIFSDDQPLKGDAFHVEAGAYKSWLFAPTVQAAFYQFKAGDSSFHSRALQVSNSVQLGTKNKIKFQGSAFQQNGNRLHFTGGVEVSQKIAPHFLMQASLEKRPYQYAVSSIKTVVMENVSALSLSYNRNDKWLGKAAYELLKYKDNNSIHTAYLWILAPVVSKPRYAFSAGYAFRYADAVKNNFITKKPISDLIASSSYDGLTGVYSPYFTPENQLVHAALALVKVIPLKKVEFSSSVSIGLFGKADNPYLWLKKLGSQYAVQRGYTEVGFMQATFVNELRVAASDRLSITANYSYNKLLYYTSHKGTIALKYLFLQ